MKSTIYKIAALTFAVASMSACSLDEYNPSQKTGDEILATFDGLKGLQSYCYSSLYGQLFSVYDFLSVAEGGTDCWITPAGNPDLSPAPSSFQASFHYACDKLHNQNEQSPLSPPHPVQR